MRASLFGSSPVWLRTLFCGLGLVLLISAPAFAGTVSKVQIVGAERVEPSTIVTYLGLREGDVASQDALDRSLKSLYGTGMFADVQISELNGVVTVRVLENPIINQIAFEGNDKLDNDKLLAEIQARPRQVFSRANVQSDVSRIYDLYQKNGRFSATIDPKIIKLDQNRVNLVFEISEGPLTKIDTIKFVGNNHFSDDALRSVIASREARWYSVISSNERFDQDRMAFDQELLRQFYLKEGYADFCIISVASELSQDKKKFFVTVTLDEGSRYRIGEIRVNSQMRNLDPKLMLKDLVFKKGDWYNSEDIKETTDAMTRRLGDMQYAFSAVVPDVLRNKRNQTVDVLFNINETPRVYVERINVNGNVRTLDKVVRREMELAEGDAFNRTLLAQSEQNIKDLGYFSKVDVKTQPGTTPDKTIVDINIAEQSTGEVSIGGGFSTSDGPLADFRIRERNFLGRGQTLGFSTVIAGSKTEFDISFLEPHFLDRDLAAGFDLFHMTRDQQDQSSFDQKRTGGGLQMGYPLSEKLRQTWKYRLEQNEITNIDPAASLYIQDQEGTRMTSAVSQRLDYSDLDSRIFPTDGFAAWLDTEVAGLTGDAKYVMGRLGGTYYYPVADNWVFSLLGETGAVAGYGDANVMINERFFLGGTNLRGFEKSGVGPRDQTTQDSLGGNQFYRGTAELMFPLGFSEDAGVAGHLFGDVGSLWGVDTTSAVNVLDKKSLRASAGVGVSWRSPMGPVRIDLSKPLLKEDYDVDQIFRFSFGTQF